MGSIIRFARPRPVIRHARAKVSVERESREARRSLFILVGSFFVTATVMCAVVVAMVSTTWTDVVIMSAFVLVFALLKIVLANALIYTMLRYDAASGDPPVQAEAVGRYPFASIRQAPLVKELRTGSSKTSKLRVATSNAQAGSPSS
jgi:protein-S-isoprenylcysteine O-methyltransferase Ste14